MTCLHGFGLAALLAVGACASGPQHQTHVASYPGGSPRWQAELVDGVPDGVSTTWHANGQLASRGRYANGQRTGEFVYWDEAGAELRRETYQRGELIDAQAVATGGPGMTAPAVEAIAAPRAADPDHYTEVRIGTGFGGTNAAERTDNGAGDAAEPTVGLGLAVLARRNSRVYGVTAQLSGTVFGPGHTYLGGVFGLAAPGDRAHVELLAEGGIHVVAGLGDDLFTESAGNDTVELPYFGTQVRLSIDPGARGHLTIDLAVAGRVDLLRAEQQVMTTTCFLGCSTDQETWRVGGQSIDASVGLSYRFD